MLSMEKEVAECANFNPDDRGRRTKVLLSIVHDIYVDYERAINGAGRAELNTHEVGAGAKINRIFNERFPLELVKIEFDEKCLEDSNCDSEFTWYWVSFLNFRKSVKIE